MAATGPGTAAVSMASGSYAATIFPGRNARSAPRQRTRVRLFGPLGHATFHPDLGKDLLCIAGGSGIAGMMAILSLACQARYFDEHRGNVFFGVRTGRDLFFLDERRAFAFAVRAPSPR